MHRGAWLRKWRSLLSQASNLEGARAGSVFRLDCSLSTIVIGRNLILFMIICYFASDVQLSVTKISGCSCCF